MNDVLLHARTKAELIALLHDAPQAILLIAPTGTGKATIAKTWAAQLAGNKTMLSVVGPDEKGTISIDATRGLYQRTRSKQPGHQVVIIDHAETMSAEAQNAFLKLLEEPRPGLTFILTAPHTTSLLATILSRVQVVTVLPVTTADLTAYAKRLQPKMSDQTLAQLLFAAQGRPATLAQLLADEQKFEHTKQLMRLAKDLLSMSQYESLCAVQELTKDKDDLMHVLEAMAHMLKLQIAHSASSRLIARADTLQECLRRLRQNGNPRAQLVRFFTS